MQAPRRQLVLLFARYGQVLEESPRFRPTAVISVYVDAEEAWAVRDLLIPGKNRRLTAVGPWWDMEETDDPTFSPDGKLVAYLWVNKGRADLRLIALDGSAPRVLYQSDEGTELQPFDWSSDGKQILATASGPNGSHQIVLVSLADGSVRVLKKFDWASPEG